MFLASKFVDYNPLKMHMVIESISHNEFDAEAIKLKENDMLKTLDFCLTFPTVLDFIDQFIAEFIGANHTDMDASKWDLMNKFRELCIFLAMMMSHLYEGLRFK